MVKAPVKRKQKQKIKQKVKVSQNVKVVIGDIKRKQVRKSTGSKSGGAGAKPTVLNISNPHSTAMPLGAQPNNMFMEYFKKQLQNQQPIQAATLTEQVLLKEKQENEASKAGLLGKLVSEPDDIARENRRQAAEGRERFQRAEAEKKSQEREMVGSIRKIPKETKSAPRVNKPQTTPPFNRMIQKPFEEEENPTTITPESLVLSELKQEKDRLERQMTNPYEALEDEETRYEFPAAAAAGGARAAAGGARAAAAASGTGGAGEEEEEEWTITPKKKSRGRPKGSKNKKK